MKALIELNLLSTQKYLIRIDILVPNIDVNNKRTLPIYIQFILFVVRSIKENYFWLICNNGDVSYSYIL